MVPGGSGDGGDGAEPPETASPEPPPVPPAEPPAATPGDATGPRYGRPGYGPPAYGTPPGSGAPGYAQQAYSQNPYLQTGYGATPPGATPYGATPYGATPYGEPAWPGTHWSPPQWAQGWGYGEPPRLKTPRRPPRALPGWLGVALVAAVAGAVAGGGLVAVFASRAPQTIVREYFPSTPVNSPVGDIQSILASVLPAVVSIDTSSFRGSNGVAGFVQGAGTGMIIESSGVILTNNHVIAGAQTVTVTLYGQTKPFPAKVIGTDPPRDIALVQIEGAGRAPLPTVRFGNSHSAQQGDGVLAIGNALALAGGPTVTEGIVSAENRSLSATTEGGTSSESLTGLIQTDAPINPGNSGGPLVNSSGEVVAMNTAVATSSQGNAPAQNVGFAIAVDEIRTIVAQILQAAGRH